MSKMPSSPIPNVPPVDVKTEAPNKDACTDSVKDAKNETISSSSVDTDNVKDAKNETTSSSSSSVDKDKDHNSSHDDDGLHYAIHQVEHRASEKGGIELSRLATEEAMKMLERRSGALERRAIERGAERAIERAGERALERSAEISAERALEQAAGSVAGRSSRQAAERIGERATERAGERAIEHAAEISAERVAKRAGERAAERAAERAGERAAERAAEQAGERAAERAVERAGERAMERMGERVTESVGERSLKHGLSKGVAHPLALTIPERVALRVGRGVLIALPALGGIFALYLLKVDKARAMTERKDGSRLTFLLFGGAAITDMVDAVCHFAIAYGVFHHFDHHLLAQMEEFSLACAFVSTFCAVMGEVIAYRKRKKLSMAGKAT